MLAWQDITRHQCWTQHAAIACRHFRCCCTILAHVAPSLKSVKLVIQHLLSFLSFSQSMKRAATFVCIFVQHCSACACALTPVQTNLIPRAIRGLGLTNDPGTGCKMCKILAHFPSWYHGKVAPGYPIWRFAAFSILCAVSTVYAFFRSRLSGDRCSWCPSVVMDRNSWKFVRPFRSFGKLFSGSLSFTHQTIPGDHFNEFCLLFFPSYLLKTFRCPSSPLAAQASDSDSAVLSPDSIYLALITHSQSWQNVHTSHCGRIVCVS